MNICADNCTRIIKCMNGIAVIDIKIDKNSDGLFLFSRFVLKLGNSD